MADPPSDPEQQGSPPEPSAGQFRMPPEAPLQAELETRRSQEMLAAQGWPQGSLAYQPYLDENLMLERLQQGQGSLFQQLESAYQDSQPDALAQYHAYQREEQPFQPYGGAQHGPYLRDDPSLQFSPSELGFMPYGMEVSEPEPRELAVQNAKAYLLQTSISCDLSL